MISKSEFVLLSDSLSQISKQTYFTARRLYKLYNDTIKEYEKTGKININPELSDKSLSSIKTHAGLVEEKKEKYYIRPKIKKLIEDYFFSLNDSIEKGTKAPEFDTKIERKGLPTVLEWNNLFPDDKIPEDIEADTTFVPQIQFTPRDLEIALKEAGGKIKMLPFTNYENLPIGQETYNPLLATQRVKIKILRRMKNATKLHTFNLTYQKRFYCSRCGKEHTMYPYQACQRLKCYCIKKQDNKGNEITTAHTTSNDGLKDMTFPIYLYEVTVGWNKIESTSYMYSIGKLDKGRYYSDLFTIDLEIDKKKGTVPIIMGSTKKQLANIGKEAFEDVQDIVKAEAAIFNVPDLKILNVLYGTRKLIEKYAYVTLNNKGYLLQLMVVISAIAKQRYGDRRLAISVVGNSGLSKTYAAELLVKSLDNEGVIIGNGKNLTYSGIIGGVNSGGVAVGGHKITIFEDGIATYGGLTVLDEANVYYSDPEINTSLKNLLDSQIRLAKVGAPKQDIIVNYTPVILCNFPINHKKDYMRQIKENYKKLIRKYPQECHETDEKSVAKYLSMQNFYLPLQYYIDVEKNTTLARTISYVRTVNYTNPQMEIDWRTGGSVPSANRILFDVVCNNKNGELYEDREIPENLTLSGKDEMPSEEIAKILKSWRKKKDINLADKSINTHEVNEQLKKLDISIHAFLTKDKRGKKIYTSIGWGEQNVRVDSRIERLIYTCGEVIQLFEDEDSEELTENVKQWLYLILIKCKRGILEEEYNFLRHYEDIENVEYNVSETEIMVHEVDEENKIEIEAKVEKLRELEEKNNDLATFDDLDEEEQ